MIRIMIDINAAKEAFNEYVKKYDYKNDRVALKIGHILRVMRNM